MYNFGARVILQFYLIRIVYIVSVIEISFITLAFDIAFLVRTTFDTVPTWIVPFRCLPLSLHEIQRVPFIFSLLTCKNYFVDQNDDRNAYKSINC
jgi:hypothetical protein